jgi:signal transduction histidine kinase
VESHLIQSSLPDPEQIQTIASAATSAKLTTTRLSIIHETTLALEILPKLQPKQRPNAINRSSHFLATILSNIATSRPGPNPLHHDVASLATHSLHHFETIRKSRLEIDRRKKTETNLRNSRSAKDTSLKECVRLKKHLQHLSRQILTTQEQERKKISRELQDVVAQAIVSINIRLATLKKQSALNTRGLESDIIATQQIVANSADIVQKFARELRPAVLDDFGLIPALHAYMKAFTSRTSRHSHRSNNSPSTCEPPSSASPRTPSPTSHATPMHHPHTSPSSKKPPASASPSTTMENPQPPEKKLR